MKFLLAVALATFSYIPLSADAQSSTAPQITSSTTFSDVQGWVDSATPATLSSILSALVESGSAFKEDSIAYMASQNPTGLLAAVSRIVSGGDTDAATSVYVSVLEVLSASPQYSQMVEDMNAQNSDFVASILDSVNDVEPAAGPRRRLIQILRLLRSIAPPEVTGGSVSPS